MITLEYKDYRHGGSKVLHTLWTIDFIGRSIRHIPSHYFNVIRHFSASRQDPNGVFLAWVPIFFGIFVFPKL